MIESWEVWTYSLISSLGLQYSPKEAQYTFMGFLGEVFESVAADKLPEVGG